jgi:hypothetical protein
MGQGGTQLGELFLNILPYIMTILGTMIMILLSILLKKLNKIDVLSQSFNDHIVTFTQTISNLVSFPECAKARVDCCALNKTIIMLPLERQIEERKKLVDAHLNSIDSEIDNLWGAVQDHVHTDNGVVIKPSKMRIGG